MRLHIKDLSVEGVRIREDLDPEQLKDLDALLSGQRCSFQGPLSVTLQVTPTAGMVQVTGRIDGTAVLACSRCLTPVQWPLNTDFDLTFTRRLPGDVLDAPPESRELEAEELGVVLFEGDELDFRDAIQEQVIMALPMQPLCRKDCRGLCARCGANLNDGPCHCSGKDIDPRLSVLKNLRLDD
jgi:uncharacterized protein